MRKLHKKPLIMAAAALALTGTLAVGSAMAYFTTYTTAGGGVTMNMGFTETIPKQSIKMASTSPLQIPVIMIAS